MKMISLGTSELQTPRIMFGGNVFGWTLDEKESFRILDALMDRGYSFIDTADSYGREAGRSEEIIGKWMKSRKNRHNVTLATKAGNVKETNAKGEVVRSRNNKPEYLRSCIDKSLQRLNTDYIDLFYTHFDDETTEVREVLETYQSFIQQGKTRYVGASNFSIPRLEEALTLAETSDLPKYQVFQTEYNLMERQEFESGIGALCSNHKVSTATYFSLASGFLTGKYQKETDFKNTDRQNLTEKYFTPRGKKILAALDEVAQAYGVSQAAVALSWLLQRPHVSCCIASATKESHLDAFDQALELNLNADAMEKLTLASAY